ncbi:MAG: CHAD domain-containing protein [Solirubrobacteraceae bacterium]
MSGSEFLAPDEISVDAAAELLGARLQVQPGEAQATDRTFYDTFDGLVRDAGSSVVHERGRVSVVDRATGLVQADGAMAQPTRPLMIADLGPGRLRDALAPVVKLRALLALVHVHSRARALNVLDGERKTVVRMTLEEPAVIASTSRHIPLRPRLRLAAVRGYADEFDRVARELTDTLGFRPADQTLADEAVRAAGGVPGGVRSKVELALPPTQRADGAAATVLRALLAVIAANLEGATAGIDSEFLHDFRVSVRRSRSVQREFKKVFPAAQLSHFRREFNWLQRATGDARDLDVYVLEFDDLAGLVAAETRADLAPLLGVLEDRRQAARRQMARDLRAERTSKLFQDWAAFLEELVELPLEGREGAQRPVAEVAAARILKVYRRMVKMGSAVSDSSPAEEFHALRKRGKELRYLLELFGAPLFSEDVVKPMIKALKSLQDLLGRHQDREVQISLLRSLSDEVAGRPGGPAALMAIGVLIEHLGADEQRTRVEFAERFGAFASGAQRKRIKAVFS